MMIRLATTDDLPTVLAIVREVVIEMRAVGNTQWDDAYPDAPRFERDVENSALYVAEQSE